MIPNWYLTTIWLGPIPIQVWGLFVALGFAVAIWLTVKRAPRVGVDPKDVIDAAALVLIAAFIGARLVHVFLYEPAYYLAHLGEIVKVWEGGLSSSGGFLGALLVVAWFVRRRRIAFLAFSDAVLGSLPIGYIIGRLGCHVTRMHPGPACANVLCVPFPDGVRRLDPGLLEVFLWAVIAVAVFAFRRRLVRTGVTTASVIGLYGVGRFFLDSLRIVDARYLGLTPAQYVSIALVIVGASLLWRARSSSVHV